MSSSGTLESGASGSDCSAPRVLFVVPGHQREKQPIEAGARRVRQLGRFFRGCQS